MPNAPTWRAGAMLSDGSDNGSHSSKLVHAGETALGMCYASTFWHSRTEAAVVWPLALMTHCSLLQKTTTLLARFPLERQMDCGCHSRRATKFVVEMGARAQPVALDVPGCNDIARNTLYLSVHYYAALRTRCLTTRLGAAGQYWHAVR